MAGVGLCTMQAQKTKGWLTGGFFVLFLFFCFDADLNVIQQKSGQNISEQHGSHAAYFWAKRDLTTLEDWRQREETSSKGVLPWLLGKGICFRKCSVVFLFSLGLNFGCVFSYGSSLWVSVKSSWPFYSVKDTLIPMYPRDLAELGIFIFLPSAPMLHPHWRPPTFGRFPS